MRNPAPIILSLLLAAVAAFFLIRAPEAPKPAPPPAEAAAPAEAPAPEVPKTEEAVKPPPPEVAKTDTSVAEAEPKTWPQEQSDIPADPKAVFGKLPNGLRYMIYPNSEPPGRVSLRLHIATGSLMEAEDQRGLAHFLEHMVFNGTKHFTPDDLIPKMQHLGIGFGAHVNAYTSFNETVYMLDLPSLTDEMLGLGFTVMRDFGDGAKLDPEEIDKERGVILSEKTTRDSVGMRLMQQQFDELLPESLLPKRFPIGEEEVIKSAPRERFVDYYTRYYTPERMTFIVVGDVDAAKFEGLIKENFSSLANPAEPGKEPDLGKITPVEGVKAAVFSDKEVPATSLGFTFVQPFSPVPDTRTRRLSKLPLELAQTALARRFERIAKTEGSPITGGSASRDELFNHVEVGSLDVAVAEDRWQEALPVLEQEYRRVLEFGFTDAEISEAKANLLNAYQQAVKTAPSRKSEGLATGIARSISDGSVFSTPEMNLEVIKGGLDTATPETCHAAFREFWADKGFHLVLTTKEEPDNALSTLTSIYEESRSKEVEAPEQKRVIPFAYSEFGTPGTVKTRKEIADPGLIQCMLSNGVRLNFKKTDFEKGSVRLLARIGSGKLTQPKDMPGFDFFAASVFNAGGLGKHSNDDLQQILAGRNVTGGGFAISDDAFTLSGRTTPEDLELQLQLMCAAMTDPGFREEALVQFRKGIPEIYQQVRHTPMGAQMEMESWLHGGDFRWTLPEESKLSSYTLEDARKWLTPALTKGYLELSIVGDFDESTMLPLVLKTFGALGPRETEKPALPAARKVNFPKAPAEKSFTYDSKIPQGTALVVWKTEGWRNNTKLFRRLNILGEIFSDRLRKEIREKLGASYSPNAGPDGSEGLEGYGFLASESVGKPEDTKRLAEVAVTLGAELAEKGTDEDELDRARKPILAQIEKSKRDNSYWLVTVLSQSQEQPERLDLIRGRDADVASITPKELSEIAKKYLGQKNALKVQITSEAK
ncbi:insulinase family protein [Luteolibacter sp. GHJ8]|uniref:Insulinase family protein n=1 Tax=Luteolibacter rhizosphaerae TaxID=2989719 RepID=A0ABT3G9W2_9BACT|nr:M16 family metallopeptidase [Luteolibacter rhizosphaerae]MCW1916427.1 insulinase family protein [Luteolibacter rhizosphaerae]